MLTKILVGEVVSFFGSASPTGRRAFEMIGYAVKTLESKETRAQRTRQVAHNSVFAATSIMPDGESYRRPAFLLFSTGEKHHAVTLREGG